MTFANLGSFALEQSKQLSKQGLSFAALAFAALLPLNAAQAQETVGAVNPDWVPMCEGLDVGLVLDTSGSIDGAEFGELIDSLDLFLNVYANNGNRLAVSTFNTLGDLEQGYLPITPANNTTLLNQLTTDGTGGCTNYESGFRSLLHYVDGDANTTHQQNSIPSIVAAEYPDLLIFFTDGNPNTRMTADNEDDNGTGLNGGQCGAQPQDAANAAVNEANKFKDNGTHILSVVLDPANQNFITWVESEITGPSATEWDGSAADFPFGDYQSPPDFSMVFDQIADICTADLEVEKEVSNDAPAAGETVTFTVELTNQGPAAATNVTLTDDQGVGLGVPTNIQGPAGATPTVTNNDISWFIPNMNAASTFTFTYDVEVLYPTGAANEYRNLAEVADVVEGDNDSLPGNGVDTNNNGLVEDDPDDEDDGDGVVLDVDPAAIVLEKVVSAVAPGPNGDTLAVTFQLQVFNAGSVDLTNLTLTDDLDALIGDGFIGILNAPSIAQAATDPYSTINLNGAFNGDGQTDLFNAGSQLAANDTVRVQFTAEINPALALDTDQDNDPGPMVNSATVVGEVDTDSDGVGEGPTVTDISDDQFDGDNNDGETPIPGITLTKTLLDVDFPSIQTNGTPENLDAVFEFTVFNAGAAPLTNLTFRDDIFGTVTGVATKVLDVVSINDVMLLNQPAGFAFGLDTVGSGWIDAGLGNPGNNNSAALSLGTGTLQPGASISFTVDVTIDLDLDSDAPLLNSAFVTGDAEVQPNVTVTVGDQSDDQGDVNNDGPDDGNDPTDDPTPIPAIAITKILTSGALPSGQAARQYVATFDYVIQNVGSLTLDDVAFVDDFAGLNPEVESVDNGSELLNIVPDAGNTGGWNADFINSTSALINPPQLTEFEAFIGATNNTLDPGDSVSLSANILFTITAAAEAAAQAPQLENTAIARGDVVGTNLTVTDESNDGLFTGDDPTDVGLMTVEMFLGKGLTNVVVNPVDDGLLDMTFRLSVQNPSSLGLATVTLSDDFATQFGPAFIEFVSADVVDAALTGNYPGGVTTPNVGANIFNPNYDGGINDADLIRVNENVYLAPSNFFTVEVVVTIDPDRAVDTNNDQIPGPLLNQATSTGDGDSDGDGTGDGIPVDAVSDDGYQPTDPGDPDDPEDPTPVPGVRLDKDLVDVDFPAANGVPENADLRFRYTITNVGGAPLSDVTFEDDIFGDAAGVPTKVLDVTNVGAINVIAQPGGFGFNLPGTAWVDAGEGNPGNNTHQAVSVSANPLGAGEQVVFEVTLTVDLTLDGDAPLENTAFVSGDADIEGTTVTVTDQSDDNGDVNNDGPDDGDDPTDDPTPIPAIAMTKTLVEGAIPVGGAAQQYFAQFDYTILNAGDLPLVDVSFADTFLTQNAEVVAINSATLTNIASTSGAWGATALNAAAAFGPAQTPFTGGAATLPSGESVSFTIDVEFTVTPAAEANEATLENTGIARGLVDEDNDGTGDGQQVEDESNDGLFTGDDPTDVTLMPAEILLGKTLVDVSPNAQTDGFYDLTFTLVVNNPASLGIADLELTDDFGAQLGDAFIELVSATITNPVDLDGTYPGGVVQPALGTGALNPNYNGDGDAALIRAQDGVYLASGDFFTVTVVATVDPDRALDVDQDGVPGPMLNQARVVGDGDSDGNGTGDGIPVEALSDDGYTPGDPEDPEDPTPIPGIRLDKELVVASQPAVINGQEVEDTIELVLEYTIFNTGGTDLTDLSFVELLADSAAQVTNVISEEVDPISFLTNSFEWTADDIQPGFATTTAGGPTARPFTGGVATLEPGDFVTFEVTLVAELDLSIPGDFVNQAEAFGLYDLDGDNVSDGDISDTSDDIVNPNDDPSDEDGPDAGDDPTDDPTPLPLISTNKEAVGDVTVLDAVNYRFRQTWRYTITNAGNIDLLNVSFIDDFAAQNAEILSVDAVAIQNINTAGLTNGSPWAVGNNPATFIDENFAVTAASAQEFGGGAGNALAPGDTVVFEAVMDFTTTPLNESVTLENVSTVFANGDANGDGTADDNDNNGQPDLAVEDDSTGSAGSGDDPTNTELDPPAIQLEKDLVASSTEGATELTLLRLRFEVENPGEVALADLALFDNMAAQFGDDGNGNSVFQGVVPGTLQVITAPAADGYSVLNIDQSYDGDLQDNILLPTSQLAPGASGILQVSVRVNTDVSYLADPFQNIADVEGYVDQNRDGAADDNDDNGQIDPPVTDFSDDDFDDDAVDEDNDGDAGNDPTPLPAIQLTKDVVSVGYPHDTDNDPSNNEILLTFDFTIENTGNVTLYGIDLSDNLLAEPMVTEIVSSQVVAVNSLNAPLWTADTLDTAFVDPGVFTPFTTANGVDLGVADLEPGDVVVVTVEIEAVIDPELNTSFGNTANVQGTVDIDEDGTPANDTSTVSDDSDGDGNLDEDDPEDPGDDPGDDPVKLPLIATTKTITNNGVMNLGQNQFRVTFEHEIFNIGSVDLVDLGFVDDFAGQNPEIVSLDDIQVSGLAYVPSDAGNAVFTATTLDTAFMDGNPAVETVFTGGVSTLAPGDRLSFDVTVTFTMAVGFQEFDLGNLATASGFGDEDGDGVADDTNNDGTPDTKVSDDSGATIDDNGSTEVPLPVLQVEKDLTGVAPSGRVDGDTTVLTFQIQLNNLGSRALADLTLTEDLEGLFGGLYTDGGFVGIVGAPVQLGDPAGNYTNIDFDPNFDGTTANSNMLLPSSQLDGGASVLIEFTVEIDHDNVNLPDPLLNTAIGTGTPDLDADGEGDPDQTEVTDTSDDDFDNDADDDNGDNDPTNDPTLLPGISTTKAVTVPFTTFVSAESQSGQTNVFVGQFTFNITNTGELPLYDLTFRDDFLGDPNVVSVDQALVSPVTSTLGGSGFNGATIDEAFITQAVGQPFINGALVPVLAVDESITFAVNVRFSVADITLADDILNEAEVIALVDTDGDGNPLNDGGDSIADQADGNGLLDADDPNDAGEDNGDDPTTIPVARIGLAKSFLIDPETELPGEVYEPDPRFFVYEVQLVARNTGDFALSNVVLTDEDPATWGTTVIVEEQPVFTQTPSMGSPFTLRSDYDPGNGQSELSEPISMLLPGEQITLTFKFRIDITDPDLVFPLDENYTNQALVIGFVDIEQDGSPTLFDFDGDGQPDGFVSAVDLSDSGVDPFGTNPDAPGDTGTPDDPTPLPNPLPPEFFVQKSATPDRVAKGDIVTWTISALNTGLTPGINVDLVDVLPPGFNYLRGSAFVNGVPLEPTIGLPGSYPTPGGAQVVGLDGTELVGQGEVLIWRLDRVNVGEEVLVTIQTQASIAVDPGQVFINRAYVYDEKWPDEDKIRSNIAEAEVTIIAEPVFDCGTVIGQVFNDRNRDGYQDRGEDGIPGARMVALANGTALEIQTDEYGRYHIPCAALPNPDRGSNFIIKLDPRTLPSGYRMTTENPRVVRLTPGKMSKANFGAAIDRIVRLDVNRCAYEGSSFRIKREYAPGLSALVDEAVKGPGTVRLSYRAQSGEEELAQQRLNRLKVWLADKISDRAGRSHNVTVEYEVVKIVGENALPGDIACLPVGKAFIPRNVINKAQPQGRDVTTEAGFIVPPGYRLFIDANEQPFFVVDPSSPGHQPRVRGAAIGEGATIITNPAEQGFAPLGNIPIFRDSSGELRLPYGQ